MLPDGLAYIESWVSAELDVCFQLDIVPVISSIETSARRANSSRRTTTDGGEGKRVLAPSRSNSPVVPAPLGCMFPP